MIEPAYRALARAAAARYPRSDRFARHFAYGKLTRDPAFRHILRHGLIPPAARVLDLGSGQGLLGALLAAAGEQQARGEWPRDWSAPPQPRRVTGIELMARDVERARAAGIESIHGDIRTTEFPHSDSVVILDVLHYLDLPAQRDVLERVRAALVPGGVLLLRVADAEATWRFRYTLAVDRLVMALRGHRLDRLYCRTLAQWRAELEALGFAVEARPMSAGTGFANVLLVARYDP